MSGGEGAVEEILSRLEAVYGVSEWQAEHEPLDELISCILSQHTSDVLSFPAFDRLKSTYPTWDQAVAAGQERIAEVIKSAGLSNQKSRAILACLQTIRERVGDYCLEFLREMETEEARRWLESLPGVGPKTAAIVLAFSLGRDVVPVDTHVFRVSWRLGLVPKAAGEGKAHRLLDAQVRDGLAYRFHMVLIQHGRAVCKAPRPLCDRCTVTDLCRYYQEVVA